MCSIHDEGIGETSGPYNTQTIFMYIYVGFYFMARSFFLRAETNIWLWYIFSNKREQDLVSIHIYMLSNKYMSCYIYISRPADKFYRSALMFLAYSLYEDIKPVERYSLAVNLTVAALTGENVFNFGEVVWIIKYGSIYICM